MFNVTPTKNLNLNFVTTITFQNNKYSKIFEETPTEN